MVKRRWIIAGCLAAGCGDGGPAVLGGHARLHADYPTLVYASWYQARPATGHVEYRFGDEDWRSSPTVDFDLGRNEQLLLGIPYDTDVTWRVVIEGEASAYRHGPFEARTGPWPDGLPVPALTVSDPDRWYDDGRYLYGSINQEPGGWAPGTFWSFILDREGRVVWSHQTPDEHWTIYVRESLDGEHLLWDEATFWSDFFIGEDGRVHRMKIDGSDHTIQDTPGLHHAFTELPDETLIWGWATIFSETLWSIEPGGAPHQIWDCERYYDSIGTDEWCQSNSLFYYEPANTVLYSFYTTSSVIELELDSGDVIRSWGHLPDSWGFDPPQSAFWFQHGATYTDQGTLLLSSHATEDSDVGVVREYELDDAGQMLVQVGYSGSVDDIESETAGEAHRLANGNTVHNYGSTPVFQELAPDGSVVWEVRWEDTRLLGRTVFLEDLYAFAP